jgi:hypothetical protein
VDKLQYKNYLNEVLEVLESDQNFNKLVQNVSYEEVIVSKTLFF